MGFGRAGGSGWDKHGTAPEGMNSVLEIHRPPRGKPSPFILTTAPAAAFSLSFQGIFFFMKPLPCSPDVWPHLLSPWTSMLRTPASTVSPTLISPSSDGSLSHPPRPGHSPTLWSGPPNSPLPWLDLPGLPSGSPRQVGADSHKSTMYLGAAGSFTSPCSAYTPCPLLHPFNRQGRVSPKPEQTRADRISEKRGLLGAIDGADISLWCLAKQCAQSLVPPSKPLGHSHLLLSPFDESCPDATFLFVSGTWLSSDASQFLSSSYSP